MLDCISISSDDGAPVADSSSDIEMIDSSDDDGNLLPSDGAEEVVRLPCDVSELFSRPRLVPRCPGFGLRGGESFDLKDDGDLDLGTVDGRAMAWQHHHTCKPRVWMLSPPCTLFCAFMWLWNRKNMGEAKYQARRQEAELLLNYAIEIALAQLRLGLWFIFEHPDTADSWETAALRHLMAQPLVQESRFDQCRFGLVAPGSQEPIRKRTRLLHNIPSVHTHFGNKFCQCTVPHRQIKGSEAGISLSKYCESYPPKMCQNLLAAISEHLH